MLPYLTPEIALTAAATGIYLGGAFFHRQRYWFVVASLAIILAGGAMMFEDRKAWTAALNIDWLAVTGRWFSLGLGTLLLAMSSRPLRQGWDSEYLGSLLLTVVGLMLTFSAGNLILLFLGLELISIPTYIMLFLSRRDVSGQEATVKYFFLSILASAILLYGLSFLYGISSSADARGLTTAVYTTSCMGNDVSSSAALHIMARIAFALVFAGLCFKITAVPFHFYAPDVYQGTSNQNAALLSTIPKVAGFVALFRVFLDATPMLNAFAWPIILVISALTMTLANTLALWQDNLRRLMAYSSIANAGYMLIGLAVTFSAGHVNGIWDGQTALKFYLVVYVVATIGVFALIEYLGQADRRLEGIDELAGLVQTHPLAAAILGVFMFSLAGIPPLAGFWGKLFIFGSALSVTGPARPWFITVAIVGVLNAVVAAAYYLRIIAVMYFRTPLATPKVAGGNGSKYAALTCTLLIVSIGIWPWPLIQTVFDPQVNHQLKQTSKPKSNSYADHIILCPTNRNPNNCTSPNLPNLRYSKHSMSFLRPSVYELSQNTNDIFFCGRTEWRPAWR